MSSSCTPDELATNLNSSRPPGTTTDVIAPAMVYKTRHESDMAPTDARRIPRSRPRVVSPAHLVAVTQHRPTKCQIALAAHSLHQLLRVPQERLLCAGNQSSCSQCC